MPADDCSHGIGSQGNEPAPALCLGLKTFGLFPSPNGEPMAKISNKSAGYRTKEEICRDVAFILNYKELHRGTQLAVMDQAIWVWSEFDGKYEGCKYWSKNAEAFPKSDARKNLVHEHLVPRKVIRQKLLSFENLTASVVRSVLEAWCIGVVVTKEEDQRLNSLKLGSSMPQGWDGIDAWARYKHAGIEIAEGWPSAC